MLETRQSTAFPLLVRGVGLVVIAALHTYWFLQPVPLTLKVLAGLLVIAGIARPAFGVLAFAAVAPVSTVIANLCGAPGLGAQLLEQMALAIGAGTLVHYQSSGVSTRIGRPALLVAVVALASAASLLPSMTTPLSEGWLLHDLALRTSAQSSLVWSPAFAALTVAQCALLGWSVERAIRQTPQLATRVVLLGLIGHAVSAALSIEAVIAAAIRTGDALEALPRLLMSVRLSLETDWNAGASAFLLAGIAGAGLLTARGIHRAVVIGLLVLVAGGLWITGSRIAIVLGLLVVLAALGWLLARRSRHTRAIAIGALAAVIAAGAFLTWSYPEGRNDKPGDTLRSRLVLMNAGLRMLEEAPVFGIGIDGFYSASARFIEPDSRLSSGLERENAHNNFIQVMAEQGTVGLVALLWLLAVILVGGAGAQRQQPVLVRGALLIGMLACIGTWMTGHPLLVPEFAFVFWLYAGTLTATTPPPTPSDWRWLPAVVVAAVIVSVPVRASALRTSANLEYRGRGVSLWQHDDTQRYRNAGSTFALFLPATGRPVELPLRRAPGTPEQLAVSIRLGDKLLNQVVVAGDGWQSVLVVVPPGPRRYELVEFSVDTSTSPTPKVLLRVGRETAR